MNKSKNNRFQLGSNQSGLRAHNERLVMTLLRRHGALPKSEIANMTGLSAQTVSVIMRQLEKDGLLLKGKPTRVQGKVGQPSVPLSLNPNGAYFFGLKIGRRNSDLVLIDMMGNIIEHTHQTYNFPNPHKMVDDTLNAMNDICEKLKKSQSKKIAGLGIGLPFQLWNWADIIGAPKDSLDAWKTVDIRAQIESRCELPVYMQNDMSSACAAELVFGQSSSARSFLYIYIGFFIGGGIVLNGNLFTGQNGNAGAIGSMPVPAINGKQNCQLIDIASIYTLEQKVIESGFSIKALCNEPYDWNINPEILNEWISNASKGIANAIVSASSVIDFPTCIIDGYIPNNVRNSIIEEVKNQLTLINSAGLDIPEVQPGTIGENARATGAASLPLTQRFLVEQNM